MDIPNSSWRFKCHKTIQTGQEFPGSKCSLTMGALLLCIHTWVCYPFFHLFSLVPFLVFNSLFCQTTFVAAIMDLYTLISLSPQYPL